MLHQESEKAKEARLRKSKKDNSPSPVTYKVPEAQEKACGNSFQDKSGRYYKFSQEKKSTFTDSVIKRAKQSPGVGQYESHLSLDKAARPHYSKRH